MGIIDGDPDTTLTLAQALVHVAEHVSWGSEDQQNEVVRTIQKAFPEGHTTPYGKAPATGVTDPQVQELTDLRIATAKRDAELADLRAKLAEAEADTLRAQLAAATAGAARGDYVKPDDQPATTNSEVRAEANGTAPAAESPIPGAL